MVNGISAKTVQQAIGRGYVVCPFLRSCPLLGVFFMGDSTVNTSCLVYSTDRTV